MTDATLIEGPTKWIKRNGRARRVQVNSRGQERQHFLLRADAVTISEKAVARMTPEQAYAAFEAIRFSEKGGIPFCPHCGTENAYRLTINRRTKEGIVPTPLYKCRFQKGDKATGRNACGKQFSVTSGTAFARRKMFIEDILYALITFVDASSGEAALRLRRAVGCSYKTAYVLLGKLREAIHLSRDPRLLHSIVEVDGTEVGGHDRKTVMKDRGRETRAGNPSPKHALVLLRERRPDGESRPAVFKHESHYRDRAKNTDFIRDNVVYGTNMISDEGFELGYIGKHDRVKHKDGYKIDGIHSNGAEGLISRIKRAENGVYYGWGANPDYLLHYGAELCWREDFRRRSNGDLWRMLIGAGTHAPVSKMWAGYWQRHQADDPTTRRRHRHKAA